MSQLRLPNGRCFCGCGLPASSGAYWCRGHDKKATGDLDAIRHGDSVVQRLIDCGYGPEGDNLHERAITLGVRERCGIDGCNLSGVPNSYGLRKHRASHATGDPDGRPGG